MGRWFVTTGVVGWFWFRWWEARMLREPCEHGRYEEHPPPLSMETMLHKTMCPGGRPLTAAEFDRIAREAGYVKRPVCGECEGRGKIAGALLQTANGPVQTYEPCPSCAGTGFGRLVALPEINWDIMRRCSDVLGDFAAPWESEHFKKVLDALDGAPEDVGP